MTLKPITTEAEYRDALKEIEGLMMAGPNTAEGERLVNLASMVEVYERKFYGHTLESLLQATAPEAWALNQEDRDWLHNTLPSESGDSPWDTFFQGPGVTPDFLQDRGQPDDKDE